MRVVAPSKADGRALISGARSCLQLRFRSQCDTAQLHMVNETFGTDSVHRHSLELIDNSVIQTNGDLLLELRCGFGGHDANDIVIAA